jgi:hypothetical protein
MAIRPKAKAQMMLDHCQIALASPYLTGSTVNNPQPDPA